MKWTIKSRNKMKMNKRCMIMPIQTCQNCVLGLQWNMKIKSKVENNNNNNNKTNKQTNKQTKNKKWLIN